ncbi:chromatin assembly factor 1 subunit A [Arthroderma uncinatum]|uniref:chromatin assembly factor 1 subunit A n=1 Tax=Arthroderma uncinatum TaxID=74035 RepID=UPI00144A8510|nr:chromatin assembly factor 1 subunit A [Arthroderma uncinatum]KAF3479486.1 chromatin assembly factor 1 subunit A [Arthroderma uncinatum]
MTDVDVRPGMNGLPAPRMTPDPPKKRIFDELETTDHPESVPTAPPNAENDIDLKATPTAMTSTITADPSPAPSGAPSSNVDVAGGPTPSTPNDKSTNSNKKRRLSPASKEAKERQKAEEKAKKEEERKLKEEEKRKRDEEKEEERKIKEKEKKKREEEREEKRRQKEEEKQAKEDEKRKKEEEKQKKERSQMKLNAFFAKPKGSSTSSKTTESDGAGSGTTVNSTSETMKKESSQKSDFELVFPPFFIQSHVKLAPSHRFERDASSLSHAREKLDKIRQTNFGLDSSMPPQQYKPTELFQMISYKRLQGDPAIPSVKEILLRFQDPGYNSIDLTDTNNTAATATHVEKLLRKIPMKVLSFREDVRPPYQGTFTKRIQQRSARKLCRNPFWRGVPDFNYDYDSEAEWEEPEEGEDIVSEGEDEMSDDGEDDMDDFLDDGEDDTANTKRRMIVGDLEPKCTGICWAENSADNPILIQHQMEIIPDTISFPIDPFHNYWKPKKTAQPNDSPFKVPHRPSSTKKTSSKSQSQTLLSASATSSAAKSSKRTEQMVMVAIPNPKPRHRFPEDQFSDFKKAVSGSNLTKAGLIEVLKKQFPKVSKDIIKETLSAIAARQGQKEVDKKWVLR